MRSERATAAGHALTLERKTQSAALDATRRSGLRALAMALAAHDPNRTLARGYVLVTDSAERFVTSAVAARRTDTLTLRFADGTVNTTIGEHQ